MDFLLKRLVEIAQEMVSRANSYGKSAIARFVLSQAVSLIQCVKKIAEEGQRLGTLLHHKDLENNRLMKELMAIKATRRYRLFFGKRWKRK